MDELADIIAQFEVSQIEDKIMPYVPASMKKEFSYILGLDDHNVKDEFDNKIMDNGKITIVEDMQKYNLDKYNAIDGKALKQCDKLSAFIEASLSISHGIKSKELLSGKKQIMETLVTIQDINFKEIAKKIDEEFCTTGTTQTRMEL